MNLFPYLGALAVVSLQPHLDRQELSLTAALVGSKPLRQDRCLGEVLGLRSPVDRVLDLCLEAVVAC